MSFQNSHINSRGNFEVQILVLKISDIQNKSG